MMTDGNDRSNPEAIVRHTPQAFMQSRSSSIVSPCFTPWRHAPVDWLFDWGVACSVPGGLLEPDDLIFLCALFHL